LGDVSAVLAVTGTRREASTLLAAGVTAIAIGGSGRALDEALAGQVGALSGIISFGMGGALNPDLKLGDWVVGTGICGGIDAVCDPEWICTLQRKLARAWTGLCYADGRLIGSSSEKQTLFRKHGALVADMESHLVAVAASRLGIPFAILRCISDEAGADLPPAITVAMRPDGRLALGSICKSILKNPAQIPDLWRTTAQFNRASAAMRTGAKEAFYQG
jgi:adenosylhomocysteine nucleosidase